MSKERKRDRDANSNHSVIGERPSIQRADGKESKNVSSEDIGSGKTRNHKRQKLSVEASAPALEIAVTQGVKGPTNESRSNQRNRKEHEGNKQLMEGKRREKLKSSRVINDYDSRDANKSSNEDLHTADVSKKKLEQASLEVSEVKPVKAKLGGTQRGVVGSNWQRLQQTLKGSTTQKFKRTIGRDEQNPQRLMEEQEVTDMTRNETPPSIQKVVAPKPLSNDTSITKVVALDCEFVGVGRNNRSVLAHVCLVNAHGNVIYEKHVRSLEKVTDFRTHVSGIRPRDIRASSAEDFWIVQKEVADILKGRILVGHALKNDLKALMLSHPRRDIRDTQRYKPMKRGLGRIPALRVLADKLLGLTIQQGHHSPAEDARASLYLYLRFRKEWERSLLPMSSQAEEAEG